MYKFKLNYTIKCSLQVEHKFVSKVDQICIDFDRIKSVLKAFKLCC